MARRLRQVKIYLNEDQYEKLGRLAKERGMSVSALIKCLALNFLNEAKDSDLISRIERLERLYEQLFDALGRIEVDIALLMRQCDKDEHQ